MNEHLGEKIARFLLENDLSVEEAAARSNYKVSSRTIRRIIDSEDFMPQLRTWLALSQLLRDPGIIELRRHMVRVRAQRKARANGGGRKRARHVNAHKSYVTQTAIHTKER